MLKFRSVLPCVRALPKLITSSSVPGALYNVEYAAKGLQMLQNTHIHNLAVSQRFYSTEKRNALDPKFKQQDRIYYGSLTPRMKAVKVFSLTTSLAGIMAQPILLEQGMKLGGTPMAVFLCCFGGFFTFVTPLLLHFITKKYVTEIYYDPKTDEYTATTISFLLKKIYTKFRTDDVKVPDVPGMFTSFLVKNKPLFVDPALFENPEHYIKLMGYDKPIDFKLDLSSLKEKGETSSANAKK